MTLLDDFAARFARGERPDARAYLMRAGEGAEELGTLIERYLERAAPLSPGEDAVLLAQAWLDGQPPLLELRTRRGFKRDQVVDALMRALGLDPGKREKVKDYYHRLETGLLEPRGVDGRVWDALATALRSRASDLRPWRLRPPEPIVAYFRVDAASALELSAPAPPAEDARDEIDRLFTSGG